MAAPNKQKRALIDNVDTFQIWRENLTLAAVSSIGWDLPPTVDIMYLERELFYHGQVIFFAADNALVALSGFGSSKPNLYGIPLVRTVNAKNGFVATLKNDNSVICYNNTLRTNGANLATLYATRLAQLDRIIDLNTKAQKTPYLIRSTKESELSVQNAYAAIDNDEDVIATTDDFRSDAIQVLNLNAPFTAPQIRGLQMDILSEYLRTRGIGSANTDKAERLITSEVAASNSGLMMYRESLLRPRQMACDEINKRFGMFLDRPARVYFKDDLLDIAIKGSRNPQSSSNDVIYTKGGGEENE